MSPETQTSHARLLLRHCGDRLGSGGQDRIEAWVSMERVEIGVALQPLTDVRAECVFDGELQVGESLVPLTFERENAGEPIRAVGGIRVLGAQNAIATIEYLPVNLLRFGIAFLFFQEIAQASKECKVEGCSGPITLCFPSTVCWNNVSASEYLPWLVSESARFPIVIKVPRLSGPNFLRCTSSIPNR